MKTFHLSAAILCLALGLAACSTERTAASVANLDVKIAPLSGNCAAASPEIQVYGTPKDATSYAIDLQDLSDPSTAHGHGDASVNPSGVIPAGAITDDYKAPCATGGHSYRYMVKALDRGGKVLGTGGYTITL